VACHRCRAKRGRCTGEKPVCGACAKAEAECTWPDGRRRKRTRREMEEEEKIEKDRQIVLHGHNARQRVLIPSEPSTSSAVPWNMSPPSRTPQWDSHNTRDPPTSWVQDESSTSPDFHTRPTVQYPGEHTISNATTYSSSNEPINLAHVYNHSHNPTDGDSTSTKDLELYYYRFSGQPGSTAIHPGINRISLRLQSRGNAMRSRAAAPIPSGQAVVHVPSRPENMFDEQGLPLPYIHLPLLDTFFRSISRHFPSVSRKRMEERLETGTMSAFLLNCTDFICIFRFHDPGKEDPVKACAPFITKAQELIVPLLHIPTTDVVTGLLLLAWSNYGQNSESGLWAHVLLRMAIRMAMDLGLHEVSEIYESSAHLVRTRLLFWSLFMYDRILSFNTGRPPSIPEDIIEIPLPSDPDFFPEPARTNDPAASDEPVEPVPFHYTVRLMVLCGRIATVLNGSRGRLRTLGGGAENPDALSALQLQLVQFYATLPESLRWSVDTFKHQEARGHGGTFIMLHTWANAVMALTYHPELTSSHSGVETPLTQNIDRSIRLSLSCSRAVSECMIYADLFQTTSYVCSSPLAFIYDMKTSLLNRPTATTSTAETTPSAELILKSQAQESLKALIKALQCMDHYWAGINYVCTILEQRASGLAPIDASSRAQRTFIALPDQGLLHRFTSPNLPHDTSPPTETSLSASMAREALEQSKQSYSVDDLLSTYTIEEIYVQPAALFDLEQLITL
ncbi:hypothetical protein HETIRDRAFT_323554, partial [Heterobasidion irregulare TC 32-1]